MNLNAYHRKIIKEALSGRELELMQLLEFLNSMANKGEAFTVMNERISLELREIIEIRGVIEGAIK